LNAVIRFLLNDREVTLEDFDPQTTVLDWLRLEQGLCGTKEGCASGDCGACTVVVAEAATDGLAYRVINSCITFVGALHGRQLITVEHLADGDSLHPTQQAMVDHHGSQCGYCTPGFVMSLFALSKQPRDAGSTATVDEVHDSLGGNLCRCTGYRPIVDAALDVTRRPVNDRFDQRAAHTRAALCNLSADNCGKPGHGRFRIPGDIGELIRNVDEQPGARLLAGGTDLALEVTQGLQSLDQLILLDRVAELKEVRVTDDALALGAAVSLSDCRDAFFAHYPAAGELLDRFGSRQVRNQGTVGGNIANASPIGDLPPVLLALGAELRLQHRQDIRALSLDEFFTGYRQTALSEAEFIRDIRVPLPVSGQFFRVYKVSKRMDDDISAVCLAINLVFETGKPGARVVSARIGAGGMAAIPKRAVACESALTGRKFDEQAVEAAAEAMVEEFEPIDDARASASYRIRVARNLLQRCLLEWQGGKFPVRVTDVH
jgi:xanthine dehydrogenase small subunit